MTTPLCYETQRETFSEVTTGFDDKFTAPSALDLTGSNYHFGRCLLPPPDFMLHIFRNRSQL